MSEDSGEEKTLPPTEHHLSKLRDKGNIPLSFDFHSAASSVVKVLILYLGASTAGAAMVNLLEAPLRMEASASSTAAIARDSLFLFLTIIVAVAGLGISAHLLARGIDGGGLKAHFEKTSFKLSNLNPVIGIKNKFKIRGLIELFKGIVKVIILTAAFTYITTPHVSAIIYTAGCDFGCSGPLVADLLLKFILVFLTLQIATAVLDLKLVREVFKIENKMSHSDQKRENRDVDGDPDVKHEQTSFRNNLLESSDPGVSRDGPSLAPPASGGAASEVDERRIVIFNNGEALTVSVNFKGDFKPILLERFDYRGDAPPGGPNRIMIQDPECVSALAMLSIGQQIPFHVMKRLLKVFSKGDQS